MLRFRMWTAIGVLAGLATVGSARALVIAPPPGPRKTADAHTIAVGRVVAMEDQDVAIGDGPNKISYRIALVQVTEGLKNVKEKQTLRVGFIVPQAPMPNPNGGIVIGRPGLNRGPRFEVGNDGLFILMQHPQGKFLHAPMYFHFVARQAPNFQKELDDAKIGIRILDNPKTALTTGSPADKLQAASVLVASYRTFVGPNPKQAPIDAEVSKLLLKAIREADWKQPVRFNDPHPMNVLYQLGLTEKDGWRPVGNTAEQIHENARKWLDDNVNTYRIQRNVGQAAPGALEDR